MTSRVFPWVFVLVVAAAQPSVLARQRSDPAKPAAPAPAATNLPRVTTSLDRTAMWPGDRVTYTIAIACPRGMDVLDDDLSREKLKLDGLDIIGTDTSRSDDGEGASTRRFQFVLTSYRVDMTSLSIAPISVRYYITRAGQRMEDSPPAGSVNVPGAVIALRSMLPEQAAIALRDARPATGRPRVFSMARSIGLALVVISIVPALVWGAAAIGRRRLRKTGPSTRSVRRRERASLEALRAMPMETPEGRREAYTQMDALVREHLHDATGVAGPALTPAEAGAALAGRGSRMPADTVAAFLAECEVARYAPAHALPSAEACRDALTRAEQILAVRR